VPFQALPGCQGFTNTGQRGRRWYRGRETAIVELLHAARAPARRNERKAHMRGSCRGRVFTGS
jgi:hypothetical protein